MRNNTVEQGLGADLADRVGDELICSDWLTITQEMVNAFADTTRDHQWIHVDVERRCCHPVL